MRDFSKGWRRKVGVVMLVMACTFAGAWIRGFYLEDWMIVRIGGSFLLLRSDRGGFSINKFDDLPKNTPLSGSQPVTRVATIGTPPRDDLFVYHSVGAIGLTIASVYLLFSKPRPTTSKTSEPAPTTGKSTA